MVHRQKRNVWVLRKKMYLRKSWNVFISYYSLTIPYYPPVSYYSLHFEVHGYLCYSHFLARGGCSLQLIALVLILHHFPVFYINNYVYTNVCIYHKRVQVSYVLQGNIRNTTSADSSFSVLFSDFPTGQSVFFNGRRSIQHKSLVQLPRRAG